MEIVLQWLDELDDLVLAAAFFWRGVCRLGLALGLTSALVLTPIHGIDLRVQSVMLLSVVAIGSIMAWFAALLPLMKRCLPRVTSAA